MMYGWVLMEHDSWVDYTQANGFLLGGFYADIESGCRAIKKGYGSEVVNIEYANAGEKALLTTKDGHLIGAYLMKLPMRDDVSNNW